MLSSPTTACFCSSLKRSCLTQFFAVAQIYLESSCGVWHDKCAQLLGSVVYSSFIFSFQVRGSTLVLLSCLLALHCPSAPKSGDDEKWWGGDLKGRNGIQIALLAKTRFNLNWGIQLASSPAIFFDSFVCLLLLVVFF